MPARRPGGRGAVRPGRCGHQQCRHRRELAAHRRRGWGRIINNTTSFRTMLRVLPYGATKAALESMSAVWANELDGSGITVNVLIPGGPTDTPFIADGSGWPRDRMLRPQIMGPPALWLLSDASGSVTGRRIVAARWDASLSGPEAAARAIGWPELAADAVSLSHPTASPAGTRGWSIFFKPDLLIGSKTPANAITTGFRPPRHRRFRRAPRRRAAFRSGRGRPGPRRRSCRATDRLRPRRRCGTSAGARPPAGWSRCSRTAPRRDSTVARSPGPWSCGRSNTAAHGQVWPRRHARPRPARPRVPAAGEPDWPR